MTAHPIHPPAAAAVAVPRANKPTVSATVSARPQLPVESQAPPPPQQPQQQPPPHTPHTPRAERAAFPADETAHTTQNWRTQSDYHFAVRKQMIGRLQRLHPLLGTNTTMRYAGQSTRIPELVQRLELMLYKAAASLDEYANVCTLERRVHSLVTLLEPLPFPPPAHKIHKRRASGSFSSASSTKRRRRSHSLSLVVVPQVPQASRLTSDLSSDLLSHVFAFVDGVDTLRHVALVNRFFHREAPSLVASLCIDIGNATHAAMLHGRVAHVLSACKNVTALRITNTRHVGRDKHAFSRAAASCHSAQHVDHDETMAAAGSLVAPPPPAFAVASDPQPFTGRGLLYELTELCRGSSSHGHVLFPKLTRLELASPFDCANEAEATLHFLHALSANLALARKPLALETLMLDTTMLGDRRMARLVSLFHAYPSVFTQQLRTLELRNNFIGEAGLAALSDSLASGAWRQLETLVLRRNILTDGDAHALAMCLAHEDDAVLPKLQHLDVSENFIGKPGFEVLALSLKAGGRRGSGARRRGVEIVTVQNCMESREAAHLFM